MKIVIDVRPLIYPGTGNYTYLFYILKEFLKLSPKEWQFIFISHKKLYVDAENMLKGYGEIFIDNSFISRLGPLWLHLRVPTLLKQKKADLFWSSLFIIPFHLKKRVKIFTILNIHDMNAWIVPQTMIFWNQLYLKFFTKNSIQNSDLVLCLSETTRDLIFHYFPEFREQKEKFCVIYPGIVIENKKEKKPNNLPKNITHFFFSLGTLEPRKNFETLVKAYLMAKRENPQLYPLIIAGKPGWKMSQLLRNLAQNGFVNNGIFFINSPNSLELKWLYKNCSVFIFPSIYEGFGLPIIECSIYNKPQLVSKIPVFVEISKYLDKIYFINQPKNEREIKNHLLKMTSTKHLMKKLKSSPFDYRKSALKIMERIYNYANSFCLV